MPIYIDNNAEVGSLHGNAMYVYQLRGCQGPLIPCILSARRNSADYFNDLWRFNITNGTWTALSPSGPTPDPRCWMGFTATPDGMLYLFGGNGNGGYYGNRILED